MQLNRKSLWCAGIPAILHLFFVASIYFAVVYESNPDAPYGWVLLLFVDFPISLGVGIRGLQIEGNYIWNNGTLPGLYFGILGTVWWFVLGYVFSRSIVWVITLFRNRRGMAQPDGAGQRR